MIKPQYSGERSKILWKYINNLPEVEQQEMYSCFVLLQNMESSCLKWLNNIKEQR